MVGWMIITLIIRISGAGIFEDWLQVERDERRLACDVQST